MIRNDDFDEPLRNGMPVVLTSQDRDIIVDRD
jgi:hypothetical protein